MRRLLGVALLTIALLQLGFRGLQRVRSDVPLWDFVSVHSATRTWMHGGDPYDLPSVLTTWHESGIFTDRDVSYFAPVYPPTSLMMLAPLAILPAGPAMVLWLMLMIGLLALFFAAIADMAELSWRDPRTLILVGAALASAPLQFGILSGQLSMVAIALCGIAFWCSSRNRVKLAGVLLGLACALKPQVAGPFVLYYLILRRVNIVAIAVFVGGTLAVIALAAMRHSHINWMAGWTQNIAATTRIGGVNDYGWTNPFRDEILDLKMLLVSTGLDPTILRIAIGSIVAVLTAWYLRSLLNVRRWAGRDELLALAGLSSLLLLPVYHRVYDAALLTTALAWALAELDGLNRRYAMTLLVPMILFFIPFDIVKSVGNRAPRMLALAQTGWWQSLVAPLYAWGLLAATIGLLIILNRRRVVLSTLEVGKSSVEPRQPA